jgi:hypothetical protein
MGSFIICTHHQPSLGYEINENEVGRAYGTHGRGEKRVQGFGGRAAVHCHNFLKCPSEQRLSSWGTTQRNIVVTVG